MQPGLIVVKRYDRILAYVKLLPVAVINGKACIDKVETEHLVYTLPLLIMQLCALFNYSIVPDAFHSCIYVPVLTNRRGDATDN